MLVLRLGSLGTSTWVKIIKTASHSLPETTEAPVSLHRLQSLVVRAQEMADDSQDLFGESNYIFVSCSIFLLCFNVLCFH